MDLVVIALTFVAIFVVELPDKTFLATLVLATKYRPLLVWIGVGLAFTVQTLVAVLLGHAASFLPQDLVKGLALVMFLVGAVLLFREARSHHLASEDEAEFAAKAKDVTGWQAVLASFLVLFAAEWGDLSQLLTISPGREVLRPASASSSARWSRCSPSAASPWSPGGRCCGWSALHAAALRRRRRVPAAGRLTAYVRWPDIAAARTGGGQD